MICGDIVSGWATDEKKKDCNYRLVLPHAGIEVITVSGAI